MVDPNAVPLLVADGDIATTRLLARELRVAWPQVEVRTPDTLFGAGVAGRPVVISRLCHPTLRWLPDYLASRGARYAWFADDNFWALTEDVDAKTAPFYAHPAVRASLATFVRGAAVTIVWSARLADDLRARFPGARVEYTPPGIDLDAVAAAGAPRPRADGVVRIGYPTSRKPAVEALVAAIARGAAARFGDRVRFEFVGWMPDALEGAPYATLTPHIADYDRYLAHVRSRDWDLGLAPLAGAGFEAFKTDLKYREYAALGVAGIYGRGSPYAESVVDGRTGVLADADAGAWLEAIAALAASPARRQAIAQAAHDDVRRHRDLRVTGMRLAELVPAPA